MTFGIAGVALAMLASAGFSQPTGQPDERGAIRQAVLDYAEGYYDHAPDRMQRAISPLLTKRALMLPPGGAPAFLLQMNAEMLVEATRGTAPRPAAADRHLVAEVLDVAGDIASARVFSVQFNDYVHLAKREGRWQLVSVLWHPPLPTTPAADTLTPMVEQAIRDYQAALAGTEGQKALALLSPVAAIRTLAIMPAGGRVLVDQNADTIATGIATGRLPRGAGQGAVAVLSVDGDIASAKIGGGTDTTYVHLAQQGGKWIVVNTLSVMTRR